MILMLLASLAFGEAQFTNLKVGEPAPFNGRLLNDEALATLVVNQESIEEACQIEVDYELDIAKAKWNYDFEIMKITLEGKLERSEARVESQQEELEYLRAQDKPNRTFLWVTTGFVIGTATSVGIFNTVK
jgi:hypothetical protein